MRPFLYLYCLLFFATPGWSQIPGERKGVLLPLLLDTVSPHKPKAARSFYIPGHKAYAVTSQTIAGDKRILRNLGNHLYIIRLDNQQEWLTQKNKGLDLIPVNDYWKLSPGLLLRIRQLATTDGQVFLIISVKDPQAFLEKYGKKVKVREQDMVAGTLRIESTNAWLIAEGLTDDNIDFIAAAGQAHTERELTGFDLTANQVNTAHRYWPNINGTGLTVSIKENRMDTADIDFTGRYIFSPLASTTMQTHATTMATIAAGGGNSFFTGKGVAWGSQISSSDFANLLPDDNQSLVAINVSVQNHSYGTGIENYYGADARAYDLQANDLPYLLHIFSAGNSGNETSQAGNYAGITGMANLTGSFKMAKNVLDVAAMDSLGNIPGQISKGPAYDGRVKPELVAFGEDGSSGAAAIASGLALCIQDAYKQQHNQLPAASLVKAILINSAVDVGPPGIDYYAGYGAVNAYQAIRIVQDHRYATGTISQGETNIVALDIPSNARNLKVTVCWTDPEAQANTATALVNDLDLEIRETGNGNSWLPWVLNSFPNIDSLQLLPQRKRDTLNNVEQVTIPFPSAGNYAIRVTASSLRTSTQLYSISWAYDTANTLLFTFPVKGDNILPAKSNILRWATTYTGQGTLEYRLDEDPNWQVAVNLPDLAAGYTKWQAPEGFASIQFRMKTTGAETFSDTVSLSDNLFIRTGFNCVDSFMLYWQRSAVAAGYRLYSLQDKYLAKFRDVPDTALVIRKSTTNDEWFTVTPILSYGIEGVKAFTFNYTTQETGCYIRNFLADPAGVNQARLTLELGTVYGVKSIGFEKRNNNGFVPIGEVIPVVTTVNVLTTAAHDGLNIYRARVELMDGTAHYANPESVYQFENQDYFVFPNPAIRGTSIRIMAKEPEGSWFVLYDLQGRKLIVKELTSTIQTIDISQLQSGIYFYNILKDGQRSISKKLVVQ